jgi:gas vesicle protein
MKYEKTLSDYASRDSDSSSAIVALLTGLAVGAVLGVLFAPSSGEETRTLISDKATDLTGDLKERYQSVKEKIVAGKDDLVDLKDRVTENVKTRASTLTQEFKDYKDEALGTAKNDIQEASDDLNDNIQKA